MTKARYVGVAGEPELGPALTTLADCVLSVMASVPEVVMGEPETLLSEGTVRATEVTVPEPPEPLAAAVILPLASTVRFVAV